MYTTLYGVTTILHTEQLLYKEKKIRGADKASTDSWSDNADFRSALMSRRKPKNIIRKKRLQQFS